MKIFAEFDENGYWLRSRRDDIVYPDGIPDTFIKISEKDQNLYCTGKYKRNSKGKPELIPTVEKTLDELKTKKLTELSLTAGQAYVNGFASTAAGETVTFDSSQEDQVTFNNMYNASQSPNFEAHPAYQGKIPLRGVPEGATEKETYYLDKAAMQQLIDDLALHIGAVKMQHWSLQEQIKAATTIEELDAIVWP